MTVRTTTQLVTANVKVQKAIRRAISSQASQEWVEGSTTRSYPPGRRMKAISAGDPRHGSRYSLYCCDGKVTEFAKLSGDSVVHDFSKQPGQTVQLDRYRFWGAPGTKDSRERTADQTLGTASSRSIVKDKVLVTLREYTGPADPTDTSAPSTFKVARETLLTAQRLLLDTGNLNVFHQSIGSLTLLDDSAKRLVVA